MSVDRVTSKQMCKNFRVNKGQPGLRHEIFRAQPKAIWPLKEFSLATVKVDTEILTHSTRPNA